MLLGLLEGMLLARCFLSARSHWQAAAAAKMQIVGCDLHSPQQTLAILDMTTGEIRRKVLLHEGSKVRKFYSSLEGPVQVGIEATGSMQWFLELMEQLGIECKVGRPAKIRAAEPRKQKNESETRH